MSFLSSFLRRPTAIMKMPAAIASGMSASAFLRGLQVTTGGYGKQKFLSDWRSVGNIERRKNAFKFVRRDRRPPMQALADVEWNMSQEYMYKVRVFVRTSPGEPLDERFVNIPSDKPMSPEEVEAEVFERWEDKEKYGDAILERAQVSAGYHRID